MHSIFIGLTDQVTSDISLALVALAAGACHGSSGQGVIHLAVCIWCTRCCLQAGILTLAIKASALAWAFPVCLTASLLWRN